MIKNGKLSNHCYLRRRRDRRNGVREKLKGGCNWVDLPHDLPPYFTVFRHYKQWRAEGTIENIMVQLHRQVREKSEKKGNGQP